MTNPNEVTEAQVKAALQANELPPNGERLAMMRKALEQFAQSRKATSDAVRLDWYEAHASHVVNLGKTWYWRKGYLEPHHKVTSLRLAIDAAIAAGGSQNG